MSPVNRRRVKGSSNPLSAEEFEVLSLRGMSFTKWPMKFTEEDVSMIEELAEIFGCSKAEVVRTAVRLYFVGLK